MTWTRRSSYLQELRATITTGAPGTDPPDAVVTWMARLRLLQGVPFFYLVPDARMLPPESIRFFQVDQNWVDALLDGAFSIGRSTTGDAEREANRTLRARSAAIRASAAHRARTRARAAQAGPWVQASIPSRQAAASDAGAEAAVGTDGDGGSNGAGDDAEIDTLPPVTGFLLRSAVVSGWPGMEVRAYQDVAMTQSADVLRLDRPADDVLFGLFGQPVAAVQFSEPAETLNFGFEEPEREGDPYVKILKYVSASGHPSGSEMTGVTVSAPFRGGGRRVVDVLSLQDALHGRLVASGGIPGDARWTAAEFALEMVQGVEEVNYIGETS